MKIQELSEKQRQIFKFISSDDVALVCDGAVRSGKTTVMAAAFVVWAMENHERERFAICGKTVQSAERNVLRPLLELEDLPYSMSYKVTTHVLTVRCGDRENFFYLFGGKDESSYMLIQGVTLAGVMFDEAALMPRSFIEQAMARTISFEKPKFFFNCNPESPDHYFYREWIESTKPGTVRIQFSLEDNPALTPAMIERTRQMYSGVFYERYILGRWTQADGLVYPMFGAGCIADDSDRRYERWVVSMDYGIMNATAMLLWGLCGGVWYQVCEFYHSGRETGVQMTDEEYYRELEKLVGDLPVECVIIDPSAASFIALLRRKRRFKVRRAKNDVMEGIRNTGACLESGRIKVCSCCVRTIREYGLYVWDGESHDDVPVKEHDHALDATRYFVNTMRVFRSGGDYRPIWAIH